MKIKQGFIARKVGEENIAVPIGERSKDFHGMIKLNESGNFLWTFFLKEHTAEEAVAALCAEYDVCEEEAGKDVDRFMNILLENGFAE